MSFLSLEEVSQLCSGDKIRVKWGGGNGPHDYLVHRDKVGNVWARSPRDFPDGEMNLVGTLFVPTQNAKVMIHQVEMQEPD